MDFILKELLIVCRSKTHAGYSQNEANRFWEFGLLVKLQGAK